MNLEKILAISGKPGLYELKIRTRTGFVVESFLDGKTITVNLKTNVSLLSEISVYTYEKEEPLSEIMVRIANKEKNGPTVSYKENDTILINYFKEIVPNYNQERVYISDIKKILRWYNLLQSKGLLASQTTPSLEATTSVEKENAIPKKTKQKNN